MLSGTIARPDQTTPLRVDIFHIHTLYPSNLSVTDTGSVKVNILVHITSPEIQQLVIIIPKTPAQRWFFNLGERWKPLVLVLEKRARWEGVCSHTRVQLQ